MIGGINPNSGLAYQTGNNSPAREGTDVARAPASTAEDNPITPPDALERRIEARRAAEDTRLERFRADDIPLNTSRALATFANVAAPASDAPDSLITGIDIRI